MNSQASRNEMSAIHTLPELVRLRRYFWNKKDRSNERQCCHRKRIGMMERTAQEILAHQHETNTVFRPSRAFQVQPSIATATPQEAQERRASSCNSRKHPNHAQRSSITGACSWQSYAKSENAKTAETSQICHVAHEAAFKITRAVFAHDLAMNAPGAKSCDWVETLWTREGCMV